MIDTTVAVLGSASTLCNSSEILGDRNVSYDVCLRRSRVADEECPRRISEELPELIDEADLDFVIQAISACQLGFIAAVPYDPAAHRAKVRAKH
jgi:hypothetical protein